jgi:hypothetical protein
MISLLYIQEDCHLLTLPVGQYGCESLTFRGESRLGCLIYNNYLIKVSGFGRDKI